MVSMPSPYRKAKTQLGHWLDAIPSSPSSATTFPRFSLLPFELQAQIWEYAAIPEDHQPFPPLLDLALNQRDDTFAGTYSASWNPTVFFPSELRLTSAFLRGLDTTNTYQRSKYPTMYAALWRRLAISSQYDLGRALAQTCRLGRLCVLMEWKGRIEGISLLIEDYHQDGKFITDSKRQLVDELRQEIEDVNARMKIQG